MRTFLAIPLPAAMQAEMEAVGRCFSGLRPQKAETIHLTIRFLGEIHDADRVAEALAPVAAAHAPFDLELRGLGAFPNPRRAQVLWVRVAEGQMQAGALAAGVENALLPLGFERERRVFKGHVTLGRFRTPRRLAPEELSETRSFGRARADRLILFRSVLTPEGAVHTPLHELSLRGGM